MKYLKTFDYALVSLQHFEVSYLLILIYVVLNIVTEWVGQLCHFYELNLDPVPGYLLQICMFKMFKDEEVSLIIKLFLERNCKTI
jgi:hypothetical protein